MLIMTFGLVAMLILIISITFVPLGFSLKGRLVIVVTSFVLAIGGLALINLIPMWEIAIVLSLLLLITAYFMEKRFSKLLFLQASSNDYEEVDYLNLRTKEEIGYKDDMILDELKIRKSSNAEIKVADERVNNNEDYILFEESSSQDDRNSDKEFKDEVTISTTLDLSDLESLIHSELEEQRNEDDKEVPDKDVDKDDNDNQSDKDLLEESLYELLLASDEVAATEIEKPSEEKKSEKTLN